MPDPFKAKLTPRHPHAASEQSSEPGLRRSGAAMMRDGYSVLERADRDNPYNRNLPGLAPPVHNDQPNVAWDEEK